ncbi:MFS transporter [Candidatus Woesearchaeota archaeon]|nr:MFS transporter [Candidatus Woesearchaeota archaeon]
MVVFQSRVLFNKFVKTTTMDAFYYFVIYLYISFLSPYLSTLGWSESLKGWFFALFSLISIIAAPVVGTLSDKIGRFKVILFGLVLEIISLGGYILITDPVGLFLIRCLSAIAFNAVVVTSLSRINDTVEDENKRSSITGTAQSIVSIAVIIAPFIGGYIADYYGYEYIFLTAWTIMISLLLGLMIYDLCFFKNNYEHRKKEKLRKKDFNPLKDVRDVLRVKELRAVSILGVAANFSIPYMTLVLPFFIIQQMGLSNLHMSVAVFLMGLAHTLQFFFGRIADTIGSNKGTLIGLLLSALTLVAMSFVNNYGLLLVLIFVRAIGGSFWNVSAWSFMSTIAEKKRIEGKVVGSFTSISRVAVTISFVVSGFLLTSIGRGIFALYGIIIIMGILVAKKPIMGTTIKVKETR